MALFIVDTKPDENLTNSYHSLKYETDTVLLKEKPTASLLSATYDFGSDDGDDDDQGEDIANAVDFFGLPPPNVDIKNIIRTTLLETAPEESKVEEELKRLKKSVDEATANAKARPFFKRKRIIDLDHTDFNPITGKYDAELQLKPDVKKALDNVIVPVGLEKMQGIPSLPPKKIRKLNKVEREKTKGAGWFDLPATELTEEVENDLKILQMRSVLNPKQFYKRSDMRELPKYFQIGTVQHSALDYYKERGTRKKKKSLVDELLADTAAQEYTKRKYKECVARHDKYAHRKQLKKMKKLKRQKK